MTATTPEMTVDERRFAAPDRTVRLACALAAVAAIGVVPLMSLSGTTGEEIVAGLVDSAVTSTVGSILAVLVSAGLFLAAVRLSRVVPGLSGAVIGVAGAAVAMMYAIYYAAFGAGTIVATQMLDNPGPGLGEAASLMLNVAEVARYAPGLALVVAAAAAGSHLPRAVRWIAVLLAVLTLVPFTSWVAALLIPVWLGISAAVVRDS